MAEPAGVDVRAPAPPAADPAAAGYARVAGVMAIVFAALLVAALVLVHRSPPLGVSDADYAAFYRDGGRTVLVTVGLYLVPFAGIAFLWHLTTVRLLLRATGVELPAMPYGLQAVAGALFVGLLFAGAAAAGAVALLADLTDSPLPDAATGRALTGVGYALVFVYGTRMAGMYAITTTTLLSKAGLLPRWFAVVSYLTAAFLLLATTVDPAVLLVFPGWVALAGVFVLVQARRYRP